MSSLVEVVMPQMGESIVEGTIVEWLKQVGDAVAVDDDIFTLSTDKVDAEVPAPVAGVLVEHRAAVGDTVEVGEVVAVIDTEATAGAPAPAKAEGAKAAAESTQPEPTKPQPEPTKPQPGPAKPQAAPAKAEPKKDAAPIAPKASADEGADALRARRSTPVVRKIAAEHGITDLSGIVGTGTSGRVTKKDILAFIDQQASPSVPPPPSLAALQAAPSNPPLPKPAAASATRVHVFENDRVEPMTRMRSTIAANMVQARREAAHCHTVWEADVTKAIAARKKLKGEFEERGAKLSFTPFFISAVLEGLRAYPLLNAAVDGDTIIHRGDVNIGVATAIDDGLIVPVLKNADRLNLFGIAKGVSDLAERAKNKKLKPQDVVDGTFTVSNAGIWGALYGIPILVRPQVGVLGIGGIKKRVVADDDGNILVRSMVNLCLSFDHRVIDGATADGFMKTVTEALAKGAPAL